MSYDFFWKKNFTPVFLSAAVGSARLPSTAALSDGLSQPGIHDIERAGSLDAVDAAIIQLPKVGATTSSPRPSAVSVPLCGADSTDVGRSIAPSRDVVDGVQHVCCEIRCVLFANLGVLSQGLSDEADALLVERDVGTGAGFHD
jgi:hypothetical protein